jgi:hypothetical protein
MDHIWSIFPSSLVTLHREVILSLKSFCLYFSIFRVPKDVTEIKNISDEVNESTLDLQPYGTLAGLYLMNTYHNRSIQLGSPFPWALFLFILVDAWEREWTWKYFWQRNLFPNDLKWVNVEGSWMVLLFLCRRNSIFSSGQQWEAPVRMLVLFPV